MASAVQVHQDVIKSGQRAARHLEAWRRWSDIWKTDKGALLDKFKAKAPPCSVFLEKFSLFKKASGQLTTRIPAVTGGVTSRNAGLLVAACREQTCSGARSKPVVP